jgi:hypothetical protein
VLKLVKSAVNETTRSTTPVTSGGRPSRRSVPSMSAGSEASEELELRFHDSPQG